MTNQNLSSTFKRNIFLKKILANAPLNFISDSHTSRISPTACRIKQGCTQSGTTLEELYDLPHCFMHGSSLLMHIYNKGCISEEG